jgi:chorismate mutase / prephenate dehydratase
MAKRKKKDAPRTGAADGDSKRTVAELRRQLDAIDSEILAAVNRRAEVAQEIGRVKQNGRQCIFDPQREAEVLNRLAADNHGPLADGSVRSIFREVISAARAIQAPTRVAYLGPEFTFSHLAAIERFGQSAELVPVGTIAAVFEEVERGQAEFGVVPMENTTDGRVSDTLDCFSRSTARICGELPLRIHHCLLGVGTRSEVEAVYSKPQPLSQCRNWLAKHISDARVIDMASTADAVEFIAEAKDPKLAAIASLQAGVNYGLPVLAKNIEDQPDNITRFAIISRERAARTGNDKTAVMLEIAHQPGALADVMTVFKRNRLNMTWIESFPIPGHRGRYLFFVEFVGHPSELKARRAVASLTKKALRLEILGSYAQGEPVG